ncbi:MAG TPA: sialidase family protein, partial [Chloroflexota bacterium]
ENSPAVDDVTLLVIRSGDRGKTWSKPTVINTLQSIGVSDPKTGEPVRTGDIGPSMAVNRETGQLYVVWQDARFSNHQRDAIAFSSSRDGGLTWSEPRRINKATNVQAFTAAIDVTDNTIAVTHYDFRRDNTDPKVLLTDYWRLTSTNGGQTWRESHIAGPFDMRKAPFARGFFVGDYEGLGHTRNAFVPLFVLANSFNATNPTDVFSSAVQDDESAGESAGESASQDGTRVPARSARDRLNSHRESRRE